MSDFNVGGIPMKTTHVLWDDQWDENFSNYPGLVAILKGKKIDTVSPEPEDRYYDVEAHKLSYDLGVWDKVSSSKAGVSDDGADVDQIFVSAERVTASDRASSDSGVYSDDARKMDEDKGKDTPKTTWGKTADKTSDEIIAECETGQGFTFSTGSGGVLSYTRYRFYVPKTLGTIALDTTHLKKPKTSIMFSSNICFSPKGEKGTAQLEFILTRAGANGVENHLGNWLYEMNEKEETTQPFEFNYCLSQSFPGFYHYFVRVLPVYIRNCTISITQCYLEAYAKSQ